ncbi:hypothetical protein TWF718_006362 [Orbilia javanica]|uniref:Uncharacterized protein n=1 Tax=Orbilia javanica TaxID=47235 RepID=A0AAN8MTC2_9PEZI
MANPTFTRSTLSSRLTTPLTLEIPSYPTSRACSPLFYTPNDSQEEEGADDEEEEENDELIYPHEYGDSEDDIFEDAEDGDVAFLYGSALDQGPTYSAHLSGFNFLGDEDINYLNFTNFDDVPVGLRKAWAEQYRLVEGGDDIDEEDDLENHKIETATVGRVFRANSVTLVDIEEHELNV